MRRCAPPASWRRTRASRSGTATRADIRSRTRWWSRPRRWPRNGSPLPRPTGRASPRRPARALAARGVRVVRPPPRPLLSRVMTLKILRVVRWVLVLAVVVTYAMFVWPTRFRYDHLTVDGNIVPVRIDRFNGDADMLVPDEGWTPVEGTESTPGTTPAARRM